MRVILLSLLVTAFACIIVLLPEKGKTYDDGNSNLNSDCVNIIRTSRNRYLSPQDEINYMNKYQGCWGENLMMASKTPKYLYMGRGLDFFTSPEYMDSASFSKSYCYSTGGAGWNQRHDYPCWFEEYSAADGDISIEEAVRRESPKVLFTNQFKNRNGKETVEYILCLNDDPTKPKEYSRSCSRGKKLQITEYGRGDLNSDLMEDVIVNIRYGDIASEQRKCLMAVFTRKTAQLVKMIAHTQPGLCQ